MNQMNRVYQFALDKLHAPFLARLAAGCAKVLAEGKQLIQPRPGKPVSLSDADLDGCRERLSAIYPQPATVRPAGEMAPENGMDVSVIVPVYNAEACVNALLDSLFSQETEYRFEVIAVDDGSADASGEILETRAKTEPRLKVIRQPNGGAAVARNAGLDAAGGKYIFFADADDLVCPDAIQRMTRMAEQHSLDFVQSAWRYMDGPIQRLQDEILPEGNLLPMAEMPGMPWAKLIRRSLFQGIRFPEGFNCFEDSIIKCLLLPRCRRVGLCGCVAYAWLRNNPTGLTATSRFAPKTIQAYWVVEEMERLSGRAPDLLGLAILLQQICSVMLPRLKPFDEQIRRDAFLLACRLTERYAAAKDFPAWKKQLPFAQKQALKAIESRDLHRAEALSKDWKLLV